jgi:hypothetical protein
LPCPFAALTALGAVLGASRALFVEDRAARWPARLGAAALTAGWTLYFIAARRLDVRIALEVVSVAAVIAAALRVRWLVRRAGPGVMLPPRVLAFSRRWAGLAWTPSVAIAKTWLVAMLVMEWRGKADFTALEYALTVAALVALLAWRVARARRAPRYAALASYANACPSPTCPAGFGVARDGASATSAGFAHDLVHPIERSPS